MELIASSPPKEQAYCAARVSVCGEMRTPNISFGVGATTTSAVYASRAVGSTGAASRSFLCSDGREPSASFLSLSSELGVWMELAEDSGSEVASMTLLRSDHLPVGVSSARKSMPRAMAVIMIYGTMNETLHAT